MKLTTLSRGQARRMGTKLSPAWENLALVALLAIQVHVPVTVVASSPLPCQAEVRTEQQNAATWERYTYSGEEFSIMLPAAPSVFHTWRSIGATSKNERARIYGSYRDGVVYMVVAFDNPREGEDLIHFAQYSLGRYVGRRAVTFRRDLVQGRYPGKEYEYKFNRTTGNPPVEQPNMVVEARAQIYVSKRHAYFVQAIGDRGNDIAREKFFGSFVLSDKPNGKAIEDDREVVSAATRPVEPRQEPKANPSDQIKDGKELAGNPTATEGTSVFRPLEVTAKAIIVSKPDPAFTEKAQKNDITGVVRLRAVLSSSGEVTGISVVKELPDGLTENSIRAARHMRFLPALKDGKAVSQYVTLEYNFNIY